jgi:hypothetical protein
MANHPLNLALRFILEMLGVVALAFWGWAWGGWYRWPLAAVIAVAAMAIWATFRTPEDKSSGGQGFVQTPGPVRLAIELTFFGLAILALLNAHANSRATWLALVLGVAVVVHYLLSWDRVRWLLGR